MPEQLVLDLPHRPALDAEDFLVSDCNAVAVRLIDEWPRWPAPVALLLGPEGSGKSHLANVWRLRSRARPVAPPDPGGDARGEAGAGAARALLLEDVDRSAWDERDLFHLLNRCGEEGLSALLTARRAPARWGVRLPDLASRLAVLPAVAIGPPDDALLRGLLLKQLADRQLDAPPRVIAFLAARMERSADFARRLVAELDRRALAAGRPITRSLAADALARLTPPEEGEAPE